MSTVMRIIPVTINYAGVETEGTTIDFIEEQVLDHWMYTSQAIMLQRSQKQAPRLYDPLKLMGGTITARHDRYILKVTFNIISQAMQTNIDTLLSETYQYYKVYYNYKDDPTLVLEFILSRNSRQTFYFGEEARMTKTLTFYECEAITEGE